MNFGHTIDIWHYNRLGSFGYSNINRPIPIKKICGNEL